MKNKAKHISAVFLLAVFALLAFEAGPSMTYTVPFSGQFFTTDNLGNLFLVQKDNSIEKYNAQGQKTSLANFKIYGNLSQLDVSNPFEIYAYYHDQQILLILDNQLSLRAEIDMTEVSTGEVSAAARSFDNGIWYFDASSMKLLKANKKLEHKIEGAPMGTWTRETWNPQQILDNEKNVFLHDSIRGICIYDVFGNYYKTLEFKGLNDIQVKKNTVIYFTENRLLRYDFKRFNTDTLAQDSLAKMMRYEQNTLYSWKNDSIYIQKK